MNKIFEYTSLTSQDKECVNGSILISLLKIVVPVLLEDNINFVSTEARKYFINARTKSNSKHLLLQSFRSDTEKPR